MDKKRVKPNKKPSERSFSVELKSNDHIRLGSLNGDKTWIEGSLGELSETDLVEGVVLEIKGTYGTLRVDVTEEELKKLLQYEKKMEVTK